MASLGRPWRLRFQWGLREAAWIQVRVRRGAGARAGAGGDSGGPAAAVGGSVVVVVVVVAVGRGARCEEVVERARGQVLRRKGAAMAWRPVEEEGGGG